MPTDLPDLPEIPDEVLISNPSQFGALSSGLRMRILGICKNPSTVREIAEQLEMPVTSLYYHVNLLEGAGFIEVVHTRKSGARIEKIYRIAGRTISPGPDLLDNIDDTRAAARAMASIVIEPARAETEDALESRFTGNEGPMSLGRAIARLTPEQIEDVESRLRDLVNETIAPATDSDDPDASEYAFTYTFVPTGHAAGPGR